MKFGLVGVVKWYFLMIKIIILKGDYIMKNWNDGKLFKYFKLLRI